MCHRQANEGSADPWVASPPGHGRAYSGSSKPLSAPARRSRGGPGGTTQGRRRRRPLRFSVPYLAAHYRPGPHGRSQCGVDGTRTTDLPDALQGRYLTARAGRTAFTTNNASVLSSAEQHVVGGGLRLPHPYCRLALLREAPVSRTSGRAARAGTPMGASGACRGSSGQAGTAGKRPSGRELDSAARIATGE